MDAPGPLTQSLLLYESNYTEWRARIDSTFELLGMSQFKSTSQQCSYLDHQAERALVTMKTQISPALSKRLPRRRLNCPCLLWRDLNGLCQPFRLFDLPEETRAQICDHVLDGATSTHPLTRTCRQLRVETAPRWMPNYHFRIVLPHETLLKSHEFANSIRQWAQSLGPQNLQHLRNVDISFHDPSPSPQSTRAKIWLHLRFSEGLWLSGSPDLSNIGHTSSRAPLSAALSVLEPHIESVEADRQLLNLKGESIVLGLTTKAAYWSAAYHRWLDVMNKAKREQEE